MHIKTDSLQSDLHVFLFVELKSKPWTSFKNKNKDTFYFELNRISHHSPVDTEVKQESEGL